jgi:hypothetical protein
MRVSIADAPSTPRPDSGRAHALGAVYDLRRCCATCVSVVARRQRSPLIRPGVRTRSGTSLPRLWAPLLAGFCLVAAACTQASGSSEASSTRPASSSTPASASSTASKATVVRTTTSRVPTTIVRTTATIPVEMAVRRAYAAERQAWKTCLARLPRCDTSPLRNVDESPQLDRSIALARQWNAAGYQARHIERLTSVVWGVTVADDGRTAYVGECRDDGVVLVRPASTGDEIVNEVVASTTYTTMMVRGGDGRWRLKQSHLEQQVTGRGKTLCHT